MSKIRFQLFEESYRKGCIDVLSRACLTNPIHIAVFHGKDDKQFRMNERLFRICMNLYKGKLFVALIDDRVVGMVHWDRYPQCSLPRFQQLLMVPRMFINFKISAWRMHKWHSGWNRIHPSEPHGHLGPIAVHPQRQGQGIGKLLMTIYCNDLTQKKEMGYLETDRPENIPFYEKFGFSIIEELPVLGVPTWLMQRP